MIAIDEILRQVDDLAHHSRHLVESQESIQHIVITGGEPMIAKDLSLLCERLKLAQYHITIETAGTVWREVECDLMSISPKFSNSTPTFAQAGKWKDRHEKTRWQPKVVRQLTDHYEFQLKFVVDQPADMEEIETYLRIVMPQIFAGNREKLIEVPSLDQNVHSFNGPRNTMTSGIDPVALKRRVMLMPQGTDAEKLNSKKTWIKQICEQKGYTFCPRLHIHWYGNQRAT